MCFGRQAFKITVSADNQHAEGYNNLGVRYLSWIYASSLTHGRFDDDVDTNSCWSSVKETPSLLEHTSTRPVV